MPRTQNPAKPVEDVSAKYGRPAARYSDDSVRDPRNGHMIERLAGANTITKETARAYADMGRNKVQEAIRSAIMQAGGADKIPGSGPAEVIGAAAGLLWDQIVLQPTAYPRDRLDAWERIGKRAGLLEDKQPQAPARDAALVGLVGLALKLAGGETVDAVATDAADGDE